MRGGGGVLGPGRGGKPPKPSGGRVPGERGSGAGKMGAIRGSGWSGGGSGGGKGGGREAERESGSGRGGRPVAVQAGAAGSTAGVS